MRPEHIPGTEFYLAQSTTEVDEAKCLELNVFVESGFVKPEEAGSEMAYYEPFNSCSRFLIARDPDQQLVGVLRVIESSPRGFQTLNDFEIAAPWKAGIARAVEEGSVEEIGTMVLRKGFRGTRFQFAYSMGLYQALWRDCKRRGVRFLLAAVDVQRAIVLAKALHFSYSVIGEGKFYMGSRTIPILCDIARWESNLKQGDPELLEFLR